MIGRYAFSLKIHYKTLKNYTILKAAICMHIFMFVV